MALLDARQMRLLEQMAGSPERTIFIEDFRAPTPNMWNDGAGSASRDTEIWYDGCPMARLDTQGQSSAGATSPGRTAATSGVVFKRRVHDAFSGVFGMELVFRLTSLNITSNTFPCLSVYNRDGVSAWHGRMWLDPGGNNAVIHGRILDGVATPAANGGSPLTGTNTVWADRLATLQQYAAGSHLYDVSAGSGRMDKSGAVHRAKLVVDLKNKRYVSATLNDWTTDLSDLQLDQTTSSGAAMMHFSFEFCASTATRRYMHIGQVRGFQVV